jgi:hypothetical protein
MEKWILRKQYAGNKNKRLHYVRCMALMKEGIKHLLSSFHAGCLLANS